MRATRTVRRHRRLVYVQLDYIRYTSARLCRSPSLVGKQVTLRVEPDHPMKVVAFLPKGHSLGTLKAFGAQSLRRVALIERIVRETVAELRGSNGLRARDALKTRRS